MSATRRCGSASAAHRQRIDAQGWLANAHRHRLSFLAAHANAAVQRQVVADHGNIAHHLVTTPDQGGAPGELPEANFKSLMGLLASQAIMGLGAYPDPETGAAVIDLVGSKFAIDLLGVLEEKTSGNISDDESKELAEILGQLRSRFVQIADAVAQQQMKEATEGIAPGQPPAGGVIQTP